MESALQSRFHDELSFTGSPSIKQCRAGQNQAPTPHAHLSAVPDARSQRRTPTSKQVEQLLKMTLKRPSTWWRGCSQGKNHRTGELLFVGGAPAASV